jgi:hypothetical protein
MPFQVSPGVLVNEIDLTTIIPAVSTTEGAIAGVFQWGPLAKRTLIDSEDLLVARFGKPSNYNAETWFTAASFLAYGNRLYVSRAGDSTGNNSTHVWVGNSTNLAVNASNINTRRRLNLSNTEGITVGMVLFWANDFALPIGARVNAVNSTVVTLSAGVQEDIESVEVVFREDIVYSAVALQDDLGYNEADVEDWDGQIVRNDDHYLEKANLGETFDSSVLWVARYPGSYGNSLRISVCDRAAQYRSNTTITGANAQINSTASVLSGNVGSNSFTITVAPVDTANATEVATANARIGLLYQLMANGDKVEIGTNRIGWQFLTVTGISNVISTSNVFTFSFTTDDTLKTSANVSMTQLKRYWEFYNNADDAPGQSEYVAMNGNTAANDELHVVVVDEGGKFTGSPGTVLEVYRNLSRATDAMSVQGGTIYYKDVINQQSKYVWWANDRTTARSNTAQFIRSASGRAPVNSRFIGGADGPDEMNVSLSVLAQGYDLFQSAEDIDISLVLQGKARGEAVTHKTQLANYIIDNICERRKDCVAFVSPDKDDVVYNPFEEVNDVLEFVGTLRDTSYGVLDSGYKYMYDRYNDVYRWIPLNGDVAGLCVRTDQTNDPWWSPAGFNRGQIKNAIRLAFNPRKAERDSLYKAGCNPVVAFPGNGIILYGDKTLLKKPSAFDRINVRRLFIVLEKAISTASKYTLFEFNDAFTRSQFKNAVVPYLRDVQGRRGVTDFIVVCDDTNNTPEVIDRNEFIGDIYIKPARSINFITLNFVAVRTGVAFSEVVGRFG